MARAPEPDLSTRTRSNYPIGIISARRGTSTPASSFIRCRRGRLDALVHRNRRTSRVSSEAAVPRPGIRDDSAAAPRSNRPVFGRPRANASVASITVDTILSLFADFTVKPVIPTLPPKCLHSQIAHPCYVRGSEPILQGFTLSAPYTYRTTGWERGGGVHRRTCQYSTNIVYHRASQYLPEQCCTVRSASNPFQSPRPPAARAARCYIPAARPTTSPTVPRLARSDGSGSRNSDTQSAGTIAADPSDPRAASTE